MALEAEEKRAKAERKLSYLASQVQPPGRSCFETKMISDFRYGTKKQWIHAEVPDVEEVSEVCECFQVA